ncbi:hypothetical protein PAPHI01_2477, partial [Pancytospora philotis]
MDRIFSIYDQTSDKVRTYRSSADQITLGSGNLANIQLTIPSLDWEHIRVDFRGSVYAIGDSVFVDGMEIEPGRTVPVTNESVIKIHSYVFGMYDSLAASGQHEERLRAEGQKAQRAIPFFAINHCECNVEKVDRASIPRPTLFDDMAKSSARMAQSAYNKHIGAVSAMEAAPAPARSPKKRKLNEGGVGKPVADEQQLAEPVSELIGLALEDKIEEVGESISNAINGCADISVKREEPDKDLGQLVLERSLLENAKQSIEEQGEAPAPAEAQIDRVENSVKDTIKEEMREEFNEMVQNEVGENINKAVSECLNDSNLVSIIADNVKTAMEAKSNTPAEPADVAEKAGRKRGGSVENPAEEDVPSPAKKQKVAKPPQSPRKPKASDKNITAVESTKEETKEDASASGPADSPAVAQQDTSENEEQDNGKISTANSNAEETEEGSSSHSAESAVPDKTVKRTRRAAAVGGRKAAKAEPAKQAAASKKPSRAASKNAQPEAAADK